MTISGFKRFSKCLAFISISLSSLFLLFLFASLCLWRWSLNYYIHPPKNLICFFFCSVVCFVFRVFVWTYFCYYRPCCCPIIRMMKGGGWYSCRKHICHSITNVMEFLHFQYSALKMALHNRYKYSFFMSIQYYLFILIMLDLIKMK